MTRQDGGDASGGPRPGSGDAMGPAAPSPEVGTILERALDLAEEGAWGDLAEFLRDRLPDHPEDPYLLCWLGMAERELGMDGVAYERFKRSLDADPRDPVLLATAGNALAAFDDPAAEAALRTAALIAPRLAQARWMYGAYLAREGLLDDGLGELDAALELDPEDPVIHQERGVALALLERMEEAEASFERAVELDGEDGWSLALLGLTRLEAARGRDAMEGEVEEVARLLEQAARLRPHDLETQVLAALALSAAAAEDRALEMLERARVQAEGVDATLVLEAEDRMEAGTAFRFLADALGPSSFRDRLMQRP